MPSASMSGCSGCLQCSWTDPIHGVRVRAISLASSPSVNPLLDVSSLAMVSGKTVDDIPPHLVEQRTIPLPPRNLLISPSSSSQHTKSPSSYGFRSDSQGSSLSSCSRASTLSSLAMSLLDLPLPPFAQASSSLLIFTSEPEEMGDVSMLT
ncbi:hypothetical protein BDV98DRAFT_577106 [Pterulicium gracile]|uniref:Uncharacterized protein n=1 Tax=Pterulicium gracile TaxID=1884261 RepID=A0A5C3Q2U6_9AGAR|nr:hypothetical protein BDV98DRAFT_577106 [Pterula gracilis]